LIEMTRALAEEHVAGDAWILWATAQRREMSEKLNATVAIGMKKYWKEIALGVAFVRQDSHVQHVVNVLHEDIINAWNFRDDNKILVGHDFKTLVLRLVEDLGPQASQNNYSSQLSDGHNVAEITNRMNPTLGSASAGVGISAVFLRWLGERYAQGPITLRCLMGYIVDLVMLLQHLFSFASTRPSQPVELAWVRHAFQAYYGSESHDEIHREVRDFVSLAGVTQPQSVANEIGRLIDAHRLHPPS